MNSPKITPVYQETTDELIAKIEDLQCVVNHLLGILYDKGIIDLEEHEKWYIESK